jgi:hypothetical protein
MPNDGFLGGHIAETKDVRLNATAITREVADPFIAVTIGGISFYLTPVQAEELASKLCAANCRIFDHLCSTRDALAEVPE